MIVVLVLCVIIFPPPPTKCVVVNQQTLFDVQGDVVGDAAGLNLPIQYSSAQD